MQDQSHSTPQSQNLSQITDGESPDLLAEAAVNSLEELMNRAPQISDAEADRIIEYLWAQREKFAQQESAPKVKKAPKKKGPILSVDDILTAMD